MSFGIYVEQHLRVLNEIQVEAFDRAQSLIVEKLETQKPIFIIGNGGSSATASHFAVDWQKGAQQYLNFYPNVLCLSDNVPLITAIANDIAYTEIFTHQLSNRDSRNGLLVAISGSGMSENIISAMRKSVELGLQSVALTGFDGGEVGKIASIHCNVASTDIKVVEDVHLIFGHSIIHKLSQKELKQKSASIL